MCQNIIHVNIKSLFDQDIKTTKEISSYAKFGINGKIELNLSHIIPSIGVIGYYDIQNGNKIVWSKPINLLRK